MKPTERGMNAAAGRTLARRTLGGVPVGHGGDDPQQAIPGPVVSQWSLIGSLRQLLGNRTFDRKAATAVGFDPGSRSDIATRSTGPITAGWERRDVGRSSLTSGVPTAAEVDAASLGVDLTLHEPLETLSKALSTSYRIEGEVGRGGMAVVYRAIELQQNRAVAVKVLRPELAGIVAIERFVQEIRFSGTLTHPGIVPVLDSGEVDGLPWYSMPFISGSTLRDRLVQEKQLPIQDVIRIAVEVAEALSFAHERGVVHRDIKPDNILFENGRAIVADFGIARAVEESTSKDRLTASGVMVGTAQYMAPEQGDGKVLVDPRADIYSLGCVVYEMLAGEPPFAGPTATAIRSRHQLDPVPPLRSVRATVTPALEQVVVKALSKVPADRYATVQDFAAALKNPPKVKVAWPSARLVVARSAVAAALVVAGGLAARSAFWSKDVPLDVNKLIIYPLVERGLSASDSGTGYDVALVLGAALEHTEPLRWLDGWQYLDERHRTDANLVTDRIARRIAQDRGARYYLNGVVRRDGDSTAVTLRLHDAESDSVVAQQTHTRAATSSEPYQLGLAAITDLLPRLLATDRKIDLTPITDRRPAAIALWLQGERAYRLARFAPALDFYERAVAQDSALAFAAVKGAQAANWLQYFPQTRQLLTVALAGEAQLPQRYRDFARGLDAYLSGRADSAVTHFERAVASDPDWQDAEMALADTYYHLVPARPSLDSLTRHGFEAAAVGSQFAPPLLHLVEIAARDGDTKRARTLLHELAGTQADTTLLRQVMLMTTCVERGAQQFNWILSGGGNPVAVLYAAKGLASGAAQPECAESGFRAMLSNTGAPAGQRWTAMIGLQALLAARGRTAEMSAMLDSAMASGTFQAVWLYVLAAEAGVPVHRQAAQLETMVRQQLGGSFEKASPHTLWMMALHYARLGDAERISAIHAELERRATQSGARGTRLLADVVAANLSLTRRDTNEALGRLRRLEATAPSDSLTWNLWEPLAAERLKFARLLIAHGDFSEALRVAAAFDHQQPVVFVSFVPASLEIRRVAARALGDERGEAEYRRRLERLGRRDLISGR